MRNKYTIFLFEIIWYFSISMHAKIKYMYYWGSAAIEHCNCFIAPENGNHFLQYHMVRSMAWAQTESNSISILENSCSATRNLNNLICHCVQFGTKPKLWHVFYPICSQIWKFKTMEVAQKCQLCSGQRWHENCALNFWDVTNQLVLSTSNSLGSDFRSISQLPFNWRFVHGTLFSDRTLASIIEFSTVWKEAHRCLFFNVAHGRRFPVKGVPPITT